MQYIIPLYPISHVLSPVLPPYNLIQSSLPSALLKYGCYNSNRSSYPKGFSSPICPVYTDHVTDL